MAKNKKQESINKECFNFIRKISKSSKGFTLVELVVVIGIMFMLFGFVGFSLVSNQSTVSLNNTADSLISDISLQQTKAMLGQGSSPDTSYGIYFEPDKYILFEGDVFSSTDSANYTVNLSQNITFSGVSFPGGEIIFSPGSGEISGFTQGQNTITLESNQGLKTMTVTFNRYGVVTGKN